MNTRLRLALQKKGRLAEASIALLKQSGLQFRLKENSLLVSVENFPIDLLLVRDDDIPTLVFDGLCDVGIVGENVLCEQALGFDTTKYQILTTLDTCACRLAIAVPPTFNWQGPQSLNAKRIATSYPNLLKAYLEKNKVIADCVVLSGSVEMAPQMGMADVICDLVSTGQTLEDNKLVEVDIVFKSQATFVQTRKTLENQKTQLIEMLLRRLTSVIEADARKYILFHAPSSKLQCICACLPGAESPTILPLNESKDRVAVHVVSREHIFWDTLERIKQLGATSILVLPIEKMLI